MAKSSKRVSVSDTTARTVRGGAQGGVGYALVALLDAFAPLTAEQFGALVVVVSLAVTLAQNLAENKGWIPPVLKMTTGVHTGDEGSGDVSTLLGLAVLLLVVLAIVYLARLPF